MKKEEKAVTYNHKFKCLRCGLHFTLHSWSRDWPGPRERSHLDGVGAKPGLHCPECGLFADAESIKGFMGGGFLRYLEPSSKQVFEFMPGGAEPYTPPLNNNN